MAKVLFHIDIDAFYASAEEIKNPNLKGLPVAIGSTSGRSVISTANYVAREYGVHSAMPVYQALEKCPDLILCEVDYDWYVKLSRQFFTILYRYTRAIEPASIDECYMDVTDIIRQFKRPLDLAFQIQNEVYKELGLRVSIGVAPTKFLAKIASDLRKPNGISVLRKADIPRKLWPLSISKIIGIGKKSIPVLEKNNIYTIEDFANPENENKIISLIGKSSYSLILATRGFSSDELTYSRSAKSISHSRTYQTNLVSIDEVLQKASELAKELTTRMQKDRLMGKMVSITFRDADFHNQMHSLTLDQYTNVYEVVYASLQNLIEQYFEPIGYRYLAIHIGSLKGMDQIINQPTIFENQTNTTDTIIDQLNENIENANFMRASDLLKKEQ